MLPMGSISIGRLFGDMVPSTIYFRSGMEMTASAGHLLSTARGIWCDIQLHFALIYSKELGSFKQETSS